MENKKQKYDEESYDNKTYEEEEKISEEEYEAALKDFSERLIVIEVPNGCEEDFTKYTKKMSGIFCMLGLINNEMKMISPLPDDWEAPYDVMTLWQIAIKNSNKMSKINEEVSKEDMNIHIVQTHSGRAIVCCDGFWNTVCEKLDAMRLIVNLYKKDDDDKVIIVASKIPNEETIDMKTYLNQANKEDKARKSYVYVRNVGLLSEAALNSQD